jgi:mono/diheme cytochrome c family protein
MPCLPVPRQALEKRSAGLWAARLGVLLAAVMSAGAAEKVDVSRLPAPLSRPVDFVTDVRPILEANCYSCHGPEKQKSSLRLDVKAAAFEGGEHGVAIVPGRSAESPLIHFVARLVEDMEMPPKGEPLNAEQIGVLRAWIDQGAKWPDGVDRAPAKDKADHWAFKPMTQPTPPPVKNSAWPRNDLDRFILARLEHEGLAPSPEADRRTLIRRLHFDVTGLPPSPEEVRAFVADPDPLAYEKIVDRLLGSPRYGERWARHWLDAVHYGESHGYDKDKPRPNAWPYRDYVIRAFNEDKPYSRFVQEQLAGDVLFPGDPDGVVALGFIAAGPWDFVGHVELPESKTDGLIARYNDRDDMVMATMSTFMSLTVHCARCHDHKFDPIPQKDYYALQAVFAGVDRADRPFDRDPAVHRERQELLREKRELRATKRELDGLLAKVTGPEIQSLDATLRQKREQLAAIPEGGADSPSNGYHSDISAKPDVTKWVQVDLGQVREVAEVRLIPARPTDFADTPGFGFPRRFRVEAADDESFTNPRIVADHTAEDFPNPGSTPFVVPAKDISARYVRVTATKLWERTSDYVFALAELQVLSERGGAARSNNPDPAKPAGEPPALQNLALGASVQALDSIEAGRWGKARLVDGFDSRKRLGNDAESAQVAERRQQLKRETEELAKRREELVIAQLEPAQRERLLHTRTRLAEIETRLGALPKPEMVYAAAADFASSGAFSPAKIPRAVHFLRRGDVKAKGDLMSPGTLTCFPWLPTQLEVAHPDNEGERRAALARWLTDPRNGTLRRSIVNRVWHHHFGRGVVDTPNDFGRMGSPPSHSELLDWLANWFQQNGESFKALHRLVLTSATWRQASERGKSEVGSAKTLPAGASSLPTSHFALPTSLDSDNRLLWRMNRTRLDAESLRDAMLTVSGRIDPTMGGPSAQQFFFKDDHSPIYDYTRFDVDSPGAFRRSIYRFIVRSAPDPFMDTMDCPDANILTAKRNQTLTPLQALALLNNPFVLRQAEHLAARIEGECRGDEARIRRACELTLLREPSSEELHQLGEYAAKHGLPNTCRLLLNSNEFCFVD